MKFEILNAGDKVLNVTDTFVAVERANGEVDVFPLLDTAKGKRIGDNSAFTIAFSSNAIQTKTINGVTFTTF